MEEIKQITCSEMLEAIQHLSEEEKELVFTGKIFELLRYVCASEEELERYREITVAHINMYQSFLDIVQKLFDIVNKK